MIDTEFSGCLLSIHNNNKILKSNVQNQVTGKINYGIILY